MECERGERGVVEENKKYAYFLRMKKGVVRGSSAPKRWGVKGGGLGEDMADRF